MDHDDYWAGRASLDDGIGSMLATADEDARDPLWAEREDIYESICAADSTREGEG